MCIYFTHYNTHINQSNTMVIILYYNLTHKIILDIWMITITAHILYRGKNETKNDLYGYHPIRLTCTTSK